MLTQATGTVHPTFMARHGPPLHCVVCDAVLRPVAGAPVTDPFPTCFAIACRMVVSRRDEMDDTSFRWFLQRQGQQKRALAARAAAESARAAHEADENNRVWSRLAAFARRPAAPVELLIPSGPTRGWPLKAARRARYVAHVRRIAQLAAALPPGVPPGVPPLGDNVETATQSALPGNLCGMCGGGCCTLGSDHAYLIPATLRRFMDANPALSAADIVAAYVSRLPAAPRLGSCIHHTRTGCSLPRTMRSDTCNDFACGALKQVQAAAPGQVMLVVRRTQDLWRREQPDRDNAVNGAAVLREAGLRRMPVKPSGAA